MTIRECLPEVHQSLAELRAIAKAAKSRDDPNLRWATEDEIALAKTMLKPYHCGRKSARTGLPCLKARCLGMEVCRNHGGDRKLVKAKAEKRIAAAIAQETLEACMSQDKHWPTRLKAAQDILDSSASAKS